MSQVHTAFFTFQIYSDMLYLYAKKLIPIKSIKQMNALNLSHLVVRYST